MSKPVLSYWNIRGLAEPIRLLLHYAGVDFEDNRYQFDDSKRWFDLDKPALDVPFPNIPNWVDGATKITQSLVILRHLARQHGLMAKSDQDQLQIELAEQLAIEKRWRMVNMAHAGADFDDKCGTRRQDIPYELDQFEKFLGQRSFVAGDYLTYADFLLYEVLDWHRMFAPELFKDRTVINSYLDRVSGLPGVKEYLASSTFTRTIFSPRAKWGQPGMF